jgi:hypothetical protein
MVGIMSRVFGIGADFPKNTARCRINATAREANSLKRNCAGQTKSKG